MELRCSVNLKHGMQNAYTMFLSLFYDLSALRDWTFVVIFSHLNIDLVTYLIYQYGAATVLRTCRILLCARKA